MVGSTIETECYGHTGAGAGEAAALGYSYL